MVLNDRIVSLVYLLVVSTLGAAVAIVYSHRDGHRRGRSRGQRRTAYIVSRLLRREIPPSCHNLCTAGAPAPTEASGAGSLKANRP